ncbi:unnamed protein product [Phytomonas sp. EM1]|nr:unnamed protein product [Phytomonas sp. EM1]|eukprot:CCW62634.1 unnamed protein product [Phytomonas sp. isolate EM1]
MGWGGPRFEFYTANQYNNFTDFVRREDAARVRAILRRNQQQQQLVGRPADCQDGVTWREADAQRDPHLCEIAKGQAGQPQSQPLLSKDNHPCTPGNHAKGKAVQKVARGARLRQLAQAKKYPEPALCRHMYGRCMYQRGNVVEFPVGRNGACYSPGVDRDRIVPKRPPMDVVRPWIGSFSTHWSSPEATWERAQEAYYGKPVLPRTVATQAARMADLREIEAAHPEEAGHDKGEIADQCGITTADSRVRVAPINGEADVDDVPSVFSHASSNGPISNTGANHIATSPFSTKQEVMEHLKTVGQSDQGLPGGSVLSSTKGWTLPQLTYRVVMLQKDCMEKCKERTI